MQQGNLVSETITKIKDTSANPAPLGLLGFGMTTVLLNLANAGLYPINTMILGMGICYGGIARSSPVSWNGRKAIPSVPWLSPLTDFSGCP